MATDCAAPLTLESQPWWYAMPCMGYAYLLFFRFVGLVASMVAR
jgi:hypothetical protein